MKQKHFYKVVDGNRNSSNSCAHSIHYEIDKWVEPKLKGSRLFVFDNFLDARAFACSWNHIYLCEVKNPIYHERTNVTDSFLKKSRKLVGWRFTWAWFNHLLKNKKKAGLHTSPPSGTVLVTAVKLTRLIV